VLQQVNLDCDLPTFFIAPLQRLITNIGFKFGKMLVEEILMDKDNILLCKHFQHIEYFCCKSHKIYFLDKMWVNKGHTPLKASTYIAANSKKSYFSQVSV
jgi:hypothetical protein